jgi:N-acetyl-anhydromuramyl-L-alanine amidase AmpD
MIPHPSIFVLATLVLIGSTGVTGNGIARLPNNKKVESIQLTPPAAITQTASPTSTISLNTLTVPTVTPTETPARWLPNPISEYKELIDFCNHDLVDTIQWRYALNQVTFPSDVAYAVQEKLPDRVDIRPSCNFDMQNHPRAIVLHYTEGPLDATIMTFQQPHNSSAHYVIDRDGKVYQVIPEQFAAYHVNCYGNRSLCIPSCPVCTNSDGNFVEPRTQTIGIELVNLGHVDPRYYTDTTSSPNISLFEDYNNSFGYRFWEDYPQAQIRSLQILVEDIRTRWNIPLNMVMGHSRINNNVDPGPALNLFWPRYGDPPRQAIFQ